MKINTNPKNFITVQTGDTYCNDPSDISAYVNSTFRRFADARKDIEELWLEAWALYFGTPLAIEHQRDNYLKSVGDVNRDWRHRLNTGKAFEIVETICGYLTSATFPNNDWFNVTPISSGYSELARIIKRYVSNKMVEAKFKSHFEMFLRQLLVTGTSVMALPWRYETKPWKRNVRIEREDGEEWVLKEEERIIRNHPEFETLSVFDCFVDPLEPDPNEGDFIRRLIKTKAEVIQCINDGYYSGIEPFDIACMKPYNEYDGKDEQRTLRSFQGINTPEPYSLNDTLEIIEFWGDIHLDGISYFDVCATCIGGNLVRFEPNPFWSGKPFVVGTCIKLPHIPYSMGVLQASLGLLHELNIITNQRLDNLSLAVDSMWTVKQDGILRVEDVYTAPGRVFPVADHDDIRPVPQSNNNFSITYQEAAVLEQSIDRNSGTGNLISANAARSGERVTAAEIQAVRDAGGNRLASIHRHIEDTSLMPILSKVYRSMQQFVTEPEVVRVTGIEPGEFRYYRVGADQLQYDFVFKPIGADHVIDRNKYIQERLDFIQLFAQIPQVANKINYEEILYDILQRYGFDDPDKYLIKEKPQEQLQLEGSSPQTEPTLNDTMYELGGTALQEAMKAQMQMDGGQSFVKDITGLDMYPQSTSATVPEGA